MKPLGVYQLIQSTLLLLTYEGNIFVVLNMHVTLKFKGNIVSPAWMEPMYNKYAQIIKTFSTAKATVLYNFCDGNLKVL